MDWFAVEISPLRPLRSKRGHLMKFLKQCLSISRPDSPDHRAITSSHRARHRLAWLFPIIPVIPVTAFPHSHK